MEISRSVQNQTIEKDKNFAKKKMFESKMQFSTFWHSCVFGLDMVKVRAMHFSARSTFFIFSHQNLNNFYNVISQKIGDRFLRRNAETFCKR
jgi:hypothetical protein